MRFRKALEERHLNRTEFNILIVYCANWKYVHIQKRMSRALVMYHRKQLREKVSHSFVDLATNVQAGNLFHNMEQIYLVPNPEKRKR
ncbi:hypothetical protein PsorP6_001253 [Peronosclerospora sorghi]|uniref:Uncharacterized protein n=1 Tax=Peronosclerospora sorghi TaxID=230839 RepID=A0ACC0WSU3_9STRA|nr:hypothetical protein PsorP6_001253 [Peronosclerospora sorghi]